MKLNSHHRLFGICKNSDQLSSGDVLFLAEDVSTIHLIFQDVTAHFNILFAVLGCIHHHSVICGGTSISHYVVINLAKPISKLKLGLVPLRLRSVRGQWKFKISLRCWFLSKRCHVSSLVNRR